MPVQPSDYKLKVTLGVPFAGRYVSPEWSIGLASFIWPMNCRHAHAFVNCSRHTPSPLTREQAREALVDVALNLKSQYLWMLDDDVQPEPDALIKLVRALDEHPEYVAVGGIYPRRGSNEPMVFKRSNLGSSWDWKVGTVFPVAEIGTGCILIRTSLFRSLPKPWFRDLSTMEECMDAGMTSAEDFEGSSQTMTDDVYFCRRAGAAGHKILAHGGVLCRHWDSNGKYFDLDPASAPFRRNGDLSKIDARIRQSMSIEGWMAERELLWLAERAAEHTEIAEIGSWKGRSARTIAENTKGRLTCIDTWDGTNNLIAEFETGRHDHDGNPNWLYDEFRFNMIGLDNVGALRMASTDAAAKACESGVQFDMVFIDADHDEASVRQDIDMWRRVVKPGGLLCGHDYGEELWPDVRKVVDEMLPARQVVDGTTIWYVNV